MKTDDGDIATCVRESDILFHNLSLNKPANQSSLYDGAYYDNDLHGYAWRANDGIKNSTYGDGSCSHTTVLEDTPWWQVDLEQQYDVTSVTIVNRDPFGYRLIDFGIEVSMFEQDDGTGHLTGAVLCHFHEGGGIGDGEERVFPCTNGSLGRYLRIYMRNAKGRPLALCEVEVSGYGMICDASPSSQNTTTTSCPDIWCCRYVNRTVPTMLELTQRMKQLKKQLAIDRKQTSFYRRTLVCAADNRKSARNLGSVFGVGVLVSVFGCIIALDLHRLKSFITSVCRK
ncbi:fucolectin-3-like [Argopecten irradians]|uniref:fucolectin-3-like n=1 Tax=Argopecten irradians TaxID=31199 RepID=UPI00371CB4A4